MNKNEKSKFRSYFSYKGECFTLFLLFLFSCNGSKGTAPTGTPETAPISAAKPSSTAEPAAAPTSADVSLSTQEDVILVSTLNATDLNNDSLVFSLVVAPTSGIATVSSAGILTYTPTAESSGLDALTYQVSDGTHTSGPYTVSITVSEVNDTPTLSGVALTAGYATAKTGTFTTGVDVEGSSLTYSIVSGPSCGTLVMTSAAAFSYTPTVSCTGSYPFTIKVSDGTNDSANATGSITVYTQPTISVGHSSLLARGATAYTVSAQAGVQSVTAVRGTVSSSTGSGTFTAADSWGTATITVTDAEGVTASANVSLEFVKKANVKSDGTADNGTALEVSMSGDGRYLVFGSTSTNLVTSPSLSGNIYTQIYLKDLETGTVTLVSKSTSGTYATGGNSNYPLISKDGSTIIFTSAATNLVAGDTNGYLDVFRYVVSTAQIDRVSLTAAGAQVTGHTYGTAVSSDGRYAAFNAYRATGSGLVPQPDGTTSLINAGNYQVYRKDISSGAVILVSKSLSAPTTTAGNGQAGFPSMSGDGSLIVYSSYANNLTASDTNGTSYADVYLYSVQTGTNTLMSKNSAGTQFNYISDVPMISSDGSIVAFRSAARLDTAYSTAGTYNIFKYTISSGTILLVSKTNSGTTANSNSHYPVLSETGRFLYYHSSATNLLGYVSLNYSSLFVYDSEASSYSNQLVSVDYAGAQLGTQSGTSRGTAMSADASRLVYVGNRTISSGDSGSANKVYYAALPSSARVGLRMGADALNTTPNLVYSYTAYRGDASGTFSVSATGGTVSSSTGSGNFTGNGTVETTAYITLADAVSGNQARKQITLDWPALSVSTTLLSYSSIYTVASTGALSMTGSGYYTFSSNNGSVSFSHTPGQQSVLVDATALPNVTAFTVTVDDNYSADTPVTLNFIKSNISIVPVYDSGSSVVAGGIGISYQVSGGNGTYGSYVVSVDHGTSGAMNAGTQSGSYTSPMTGCGSSVSGGGSVYQGTATLTVRDASNAITTASVAVDCIAMELVLVSGPSSPTWDFNTVQSIDIRMKGGLESYPGTFNFMPSCSQMAVTGGGTVTITASGNSACTDTFSVYDSFIASYVSQNFSVTIAPLTVSFDTTTISCGGSFSWTTSGGNGTNMFYFDGSSWSIYSSSGTQSGTSSNTNHTVKVCDGTTACSPDYTITESGCWVNSTPSISLDTTTPSCSASVTVSISDGNPNFNLYRDGSDQGSIASGGTASGLSNNGSAVLKVCDNEGDCSNEMTITVSDCL